MEVRNVIHWRVQGGAPGTCPPPKGPNSFVFDIQILRNVAASESPRPPYEVHARPYGKSWIRHCY